MKNLLFSVIFIVLTVSITTAQEVNKKVWDSDLEENILTGLCNRNGLNTGEFGKYFKEEYNSYNPDEKVITKLRDKFDTIKNCKITVIFGEWCSDSQREVPRFFKIIDKCDFNEDNIKIYAVNRKKEGVTVDISKYGIDFVPTFIVFVDGKEKGRIIETPENTLEEDLLKILE